MKPRTAIEVAQGLVIETFDAFRVGGALMVRLGIEVAKRVLAGLSCQTK